MSTKMSETSIQDLPDEMLEHILRFLNLDDCRSALRVCRRWSTLKPFDWSSVRLVVDFVRNRGQEANYHRTLLASSCQYKHLVFHFGYDTDKNELLVKILQHFSHKVETLKLISYASIPIKQILITQILSLCFNLRYLHIDSCTIDFGLRELEISPMHNLEELYLGNNLPSLIPNMMNIMPNITRLHMHIHHSEEALIFLRHFSSQLVELNLWNLSEDDFLTVCEMQFPLLEKLKFEGFNVFLDGFVEAVEKIVRFFHQLPLLKKVTLRCNLDDWVIQNLCRSCVNIQFLCVRMRTVSQSCFRAICELKHLKHLRIDRATVDVPSDIYPPQTSLRKLTLFSAHVLHEAEFNSFVQRAFPNLSVMELLHLMSHTTVDRLIKWDGQISSNIPSLQCLVVSEPNSKTTLSQFLEFCASHAPKELRFKCKDIFFHPGHVIPNQNPVQKLFLDSPQISPIVLQKLISSMKELRLLEIVLPDSCSPEGISSLRKQFPRCNVVTKRKAVI